MENKCTGCGAVIPGNICHYCGNIYSHDDILVYERIVKVVEYIPHQHEEDFILSPFWQNFIMYKDTQFSPFIACIMIFMALIFILGKLCEK